MCQGDGRAPQTEHVHHEHGKRWKMRTPAWTPEGTTSFQIQLQENTPKSFFWEVFHVLTALGPRPAQTCPNPFRQSLSTSAPLILSLHSVVLWEGCFMHHRIFGGIPGSYLLNASSAISPGYDTNKWLPVRTMTLRSWETSTGAYRKKNGIYLARYQILND